MIPELIKEITKRELQLYKDPHIDMVKAIYGSRHQYNNTIEEPHLIKMVSVFFLWKSLVGS